MADRYSEIIRAAEAAIADEEYREAARRVAEWNAKDLPGDIQDYPDYPGESAVYLGTVGANVRRHFQISSLAVGAALKLASNIALGRISSLEDPKCREIVSKTGRGTFDMEN